MFLKLFFVSQNPFKLKIDDSKECLFMGLKLPIVTVLEIKVEKTFKTWESMAHILVTVSAIMSPYLLWPVSHCAVMRDRKKGQAREWHLVALLKASRRRENLGGHLEGGLERKENRAHFIQVDRLVQFKLISTTWTWCSMVLEEGGFWSRALVCSSGTCHSLATALVLAQTLQFGFGFGNQISKYLIHCHFWCLLTSVFSVIPSYLNIIKMLLIE